MFGERVKQSGAVKFAILAVTKKSPWDSIGVTIALKKERRENRLRWTTEVNAKNISAGRRALSTECSLGGG